MAIFYSFVKLQRLYVKQFRKQRVISRHFSNSTGCLDIAPSTASRWDFLQVSRDQTTHDSGQPIMIAQKMARKPTPENMKILDRIWLYQDSIISWKKWIDKIDNVMYILSDTIWCYTMSYRLIQYGIPISLVHIIIIQKYNQYHS